MGTYKINDKGSGKMFEIITTHKIPKFTKKDIEMALRFLTLKKYKGDLFAQSK